MVGPTELADFELMVFEQAVDSIWKSGDVVMHEVLEAGDGTERSLLGMRHLGKRSFLRTCAIECPDGMMCPP